MLQKAWYRPGGCAGLPLHKNQATMQTNARDHTTICLTRVDSAPIVGSIEVVSRAGPLFFPPLNSR